MTLSASDVRAAEHEGRLQRLRLAHLLRCDESRITSPSDTMHARRLMRAAADRSGDYDLLLAERDTQRLFDAGALWFAKSGEP